MSKLIALRDAMVDEIERNSCLSDEDAEKYAEGILDGYAVGTGLLRECLNEEEARELVRKSIELNQFEDEE